MYSNFIRIEFEFDCFGSIIDDPRGRYTRCGHFCGQHRIEVGGQLLRSTRLNALALISLPPPSTGTQSPHAGLSRYGAEGAPKLRRTKSGPA